MKKEDAIAKFKGDVAEMAHGDIGAISELIDRFHTPLAELYDNGFSNGYIEGRIDEQEVQTEGNE